MPYNNEAPFVAGSETSEEAAKSVYAGPIRARVSHVLQGRAALGATDEELEKHFDMKHQTISARRRELVLMGKAKDSGTRRKTSSGRWATVWIACDEAPTKAQPLKKPCPLCGGDGYVRDPYQEADQQTMFEGWGSGEEGRVP